MSTKRKPGSGGFSRAKFLGILGKLGLLSLIPGGVANAAERTGLRRMETDETLVTRGDITFSASAKLTRSPMIKGKALSREILDAKLSTENLGNIRDLLTGRFFGKAAEAACNDEQCIPYTGGDFINWNLGNGDSDSGCFMFADAEGLGGVDSCSHYLTYRMDGDKLSILYAYDFANERRGAMDIIGSGTGQCFHCSNFCEAACGGEYCQGVCAPQAAIDMFEIVSYPSDKFVSEIMEILKTTDAGVIQKELKTIMFSDGVLNMGLEHLVVTANEMLSEEITITG